MLVHPVKGYMTGVCVGFDPYIPWGKSEKVQYKLVTFYYIKIVLHQNTLHFTYGRIRQYISNTTTQKTDPDFIGSCFQSQVHDCRQNHHQYNYHLAEIHDFWLWGTLTWETPLGSLTGCTRSVLVFHHFGKLCTNFDSSVYLYLSQSVVMLKKVQFLDHRKCSPSAVSASSHSLTITPQLKQRTLSPIPWYTNPDLAKSTVFGPNRYFGHSLNERSLLCKEVYPLNTTGKE